MKETELKPEFDVRKVRKKLVSWISFIIFIVVNQ
jgi:hypothetical protein